MRGRDRQTFSLWQTEIWEKAGKDEVPIELYQLPEMLEVVEGKLEQAGKSWEEGTMGWVDELVGVLEKIMVTLEYYLVDTETVLDRHVKGLKGEGHD